MVLIDSPKLKHATKKESSPSSELRSYAYVEERKANCGGCGPVGGYLNSGSSVDGLLVSAIWPGTSPATFALSNSCAICGRGVGGNPFGISPRLDRTDNVNLCARGNRFVRSFRFGLAIDNP